MENPRGNGGRRGRDGYAEDERAAAGRRRASDADGGFWDDERERRPRRSRNDYDDERSQRRSSAARAENGREGGRRRASSGYDDDRAARRPRDGYEDDRPSRRRARDDYDDDRPPRRRARDDYDDDRGGRRATSGARSEAGGRRRAAAPPPRGRRRSKDHDEEIDERGPLKRFFAKTWKPVLISCGVIFVVCVAAFGIAYAQLPDAADMDAQASVEQAATSVTFADGSEATSFGEVNRIPVTREQIPQTVVNGVLASEQRTFYTDPAISPTGMLRAVLSGGSAGGGSTITQQMARNYYDGLSQDRSYLRKIKEILISLKVEQSLSKDEILTQYLNTIYFGRGASGVQAAAQAYFDKNVEDLDAAEGAFIGTIIQQPSNFENVQPGSEMEKILKERWQYTVDGMVAMHEEDPNLGISQEEADKLEFPETAPLEAGDNYAGYRGYIQEAVKRELENRYDLTAEQYAVGGYQVKTSLEEDLMIAAEEAVTSTLPSFESIPEETNFGLAAVEPATGEIKAFYGGTDPLTDADNSLIQQGQAGSAFKPYALAAGLSQGISLDSTFDGDSPQTFAGISEPIQNDSDVSYGPVDLVQSTADSVNTSYVKLAEIVGPEEVVATAERSGIPESRRETVTAIGSNVVLGTMSVTALDQAAGYATFANKGMHLPQHMITEVKDRNGEILRPKDQDIIDAGGSRAFSAEVAADATYAMTQVVENGGGKEAALPDGRPVAGKTGTSNQATSAWFVGYTPQLSAAVGLHRSDNQPLEIPGLGSDVYGGTTSAKIWKAFMTKAMEGQEIQQFPGRANVGSPQSFVPTPTPEPSDEPEPSDSPEPTPSTTQSESPDPTPSHSEPAQPGRPDCEEQSWLPQCQEETPDPEQPDGPGWGDNNTGDPGRPEDPDGNPFGW
ncbi:transglycosylase domain-containing protein [Marinactinospora thermotolerans]|uniref:transglycosylase domain-containing protein n=1 Tax=Marinactinospora thermotolerans TaxID=531310 RepID=UPI001F266CF6|nr:transglycosylase domain-containing protein [Marinactinospora thermotolerans]